VIIIINNEPRSFEDQKTITEVLEYLEIDATKGIAVAVNKKVITKSNWNKYELKDQDKVILIKATQGG